MLWSQQVAGRRRADAPSSLNSGGANCYTGPAGFADTHATAEQVAEVLGIGAGDVAVCSTGLIGVLLDRWTAARRRRARGRRAAATAAELAAADGDHDHRHRAQAGGRRSVTAGHRRRDGQGRRHARARPGHDARRPHHRRRRRRRRPRIDALRAATGVTFDRLDSDGCMSTNDTVLLLASGASRRRPRPTRSSPTRCTGVCHDLAQQLLRDAEGAEHDIAITVSRRGHRGRRGRRRPRGRPRATCSSARSTARTRTGAGSSPRSARTDAAFDPRPRRRAQRRLGLPGQRHRRRAATSSTCPRARWP